MSDPHWSELRRLFDAVADLTPAEQTDRLAELTRDSDLRREVLDLLRAETRTLERASGPLRSVLADAVRPEAGPGDRLGPWRLLHQIGAGGMGAVFLAERADALYARQVAIKLLLGLPDGAAIARLAGERDILAGLQHSGIARLYDGGTTPRGQPYLVMEYVDGLPVDAYCRERNLDLEQRLALFLRLCHAVQAAHARLVVHRDIKPENVLVRADGEPVLLDFGIAQMLEGAGAGAGYATPAYAAPELLEGGPPRVASDVFGLGLLLVELVTDRKLGRSGSDRNQVVAAPSGRAAATLPWRGRLRGDIDAITACACALDPEKRYGTVEALADDVARYLARAPVRARRGGRGYRVRRFLRRQWREVVAATAVLALVTSLTAVFVVHLSQAREAAQQEALVAREVSDFLVAAFEAADPRKRGARGTESASAREVLDAGALRVGDALDATPAVRARLQSVLGLAYKNIGEPQRAEALLRSAADGLLALEPARTGEAAAALHELAVVLSNARRGEEAEAAARQSLALLDTEGDDLARSHAFNALGLALMTRQDYPASQAALERALALRRQASQTGDVASILHNLGLLHRNRGDYAAAERSLEEALVLKRKSGARTVDVWFSRQALATTVMQQGRLAEARSLLDANLALALQLYGPDADATGDVHNELAGLAQDLGDFRAASRHYAEALRIEAVASGADSVAYSVVLNNTATLDEVRGDTAAAEAGYRKALEIRRRHLGNDDPSALRAEANLGRLLMRTARPDAAEPLLRRTLEVWSSRLEPAAPDLLVSRLGWIEWQIRTGALEAAADALAGVEPADGWPGPGLALRHAGLAAELAQRRGDRDAAVDAWTAVLAATEGQYGSASATSARARIPLAETLTDVGRIADARDQLGQAHSVLVDQLVAGSDLDVRMQRLRAALAGVSE